jgi:hypothetical protein
VHLHDLYICTVSPVLYKIRYRSINGTKVGLPVTVLVIAMMCSIVPLLSILTHPLFLIRSDHTGHQGFL